jgi:hypothetical protein
VSVGARTAPKPVAYPKFDGLLSVFFVLRLRLWLIRKPGQQVNQDFKR